jgi:hypothetical protein
MILIQSLEAPIDKPFVVTESDVDIFSCQEDQDNVEPLLQKRKDFHLTLPRSTGTNRRSSIGSSSSSSRRSSIGSSSSSSICSKSFNSEKREHRRRPVFFETKPRKLKKTVTFHRKVSIRTMPKLNLPEEELTSRWYQKYELAHIKNEVTETIRMAKNKELPAENGENTLRGLPKKQRRRSLRIMTLTCVLDEQKRQARDQVNDPERLAKLYASFAFAAKQTAQEMARLDVKAVQEDNEI